MKTLNARSCSLALTLGSVLLGGSAAFAADTILQKVPALTVAQAPAYPENLARQSLGAGVEGDPANISGAATLLGGDPTATWDVPQGTTSLVISLSKIENIDRIALAARGVKGSVSIATANAKLAADSPQWQTVEPQEFGDGGIDVSLGAREAKYVRLTFDVKEAGQVSGLGVYANPRISDFTAPREQDAAKEGSHVALVSYNRTSDIHSKARALYVSSGADIQQANNVIDDRTSTSYTFAAEDGTPTTVVDLGKVTNLRRLSAVYSPRAGSMEFYVMQSLPTDAKPAPASGDMPLPNPGGMPETLNINDATWASLKAVGTTTDDGALGRASVDFPSTSGRYVMVRWIGASQQEGSFSLAEVAAFEGAKNGTLVAANTVVTEEREGESVEYDGKTMIDGKTMMDAKDMPGEGPDEAPPGEGPPPTLPQPPPFTFVPVLVPNSP